MKLYHLNFNSLKICFVWQTEALSVTLELKLKHVFIHHTILLRIYSTTYMFGNSGVTLNTSFQVH